MALVVITLVVLPVSAMAKVHGVYWTDRDNGTLNFNNLRGSSNVLANGSRLQDVVLDASTNTLYYSDWGLGSANPADGAINKIKTSGTGQSNVYTGGDAIHQLALDLANGRIYFARGVTYAGWEVSRVNTDGTGYTQLIGNTSPANGFHFPSGIALDLVNSLIYFGDIGVLSSIGSVNSIDTAGGSFAQLTPHVSGQGRNFAYDSVTGTIFLTQHSPQSPGSNGGVFTYNIGSGQLTQIAGSGNSGNWGIQIDPSDQRVYFTDYVAGQILSTRYDGTDQQVLLSGLTNPYGLALEFREPSSIPTLSFGGIILLILLVSGIVLVTVRRH